MELTLALVALAVVLGFAMIRPHGWPEAVVAVPAAGLLIAFGVISWHEAAAEVSRLLPVVGFLAAVLVLARLCDDEGLFRAAGAAMARSNSGSQQRLLATVFVDRGGHHGDPEPGCDRRAADARWCSRPPAHCGSLPDRTRTPPRTWPTVPRCCFRCRT